MSQVLDDKPRHLPATWSRGHRIGATATGGRALGRGPRAAAGRRGRMERDVDAR
jgi:hypothetical protein